MDIVLNSALASATNARLSQSTTPLKAQVQLQDSAVRTIGDTPAAIYHPSEPVSGTQALVATTTWVGRSQSADFPAAAAQHKQAHEALKASFAEFNAALAHVFPDLAEKKFGFTVDADGNLKALDSAGELTASDLKQLDTLLNASSTLKSMAVAYRDASIELVATDSPWGGSYLGGYNLNKENFDKTIDLGALFIEAKGSLPSRERIAGWFSEQLWSKGEVATEASEAAMLAERSARR